MSVFSPLPADPGDVDIIKAEVIRNGMTSAAAEMSETIVRTAYNPLLYDVKDFGVTILSPQGHLWADAPGLAVFLGALAGTIRTSLEARPVQDYAEGDVLIANCPYSTGTHLSDTAIYAPIFVDGEVVAFAASMAHWADIGGRSAGGWDPSSTSIYQEGVRFRHQRLIHGGERDEDLYRLIADNVRLPEIVLGDLSAQIAACHTASERVRSLCQRHGAQDVGRAMDFVINRSMESLKRRVAELPDGSFAQEQRLDFDGVDANYIPRLGLEVTIAGDRLRADLSSSADVAPGPVNCPSIGASSIVYAALKGVFAPNEPTNHAHLSFAELAFPDKPSLVSPIEPAPCDSYGLVCRALYETTVRTMGSFAPDRSRAGGYQMVGMYLMRHEGPRDSWFTHTEPLPGGFGAFDGGDGSTLVFGGDTPLLPAEVLERRYPVRCEQVAFETEAAGAGEYRGGFGLRRDLRTLVDSTVVKPSFEATKDLLAKGAQGGEPGAPAALFIEYPDGHTEQLGSRPEPFALPKDTVVSIRTGGGAGYGNPLDRQPERVRADVRDDLLTADQARLTYGVVLDADQVIDPTATDRERAARRSPQRPDPGTKEPA